MKFATSLIVLVSFFTNVRIGFSQDVNISVVESKDILAFAHSVDEIHKFKSDSISVKVFEYGFVTNQPVEGFEGMDVILYKLLILARQLNNDERTTVNNVWVEGGFYNPREYQFDSITKQLSFKVGLDDQPKVVRLEFSTEGVAVVK